MNAFLELSQLTKCYDTDRGPIAVVKDFNLRIAEGEFVCIIGHSGCGKSTVLSIVMGLNEASEGGVILGGREISGPGLERGVVFQSSALLPWMTARENVLLAVEQVKRQKTRRERRELADEFLASVNLLAIADSYPEELSAGMRQRVGIARAFALAPKVLLLDEPFSLLDVITRMELQEELMTLWQKERKTVLMVTHDVDEALLLADRIVMMTSGPAATVGDILTVPFARPRARLSMADDGRYHVARKRLLDFLESTGCARTRMAATEPRQAQPATVAPEEIFVVEKYTGLNRFRARYRKAQHRATAPAGPISPTIDDLAPAQRESAI